MLYWLYLYSALCYPHSENSPGNYMEGNGVIFLPVFVTQNSCFPFEVALSTWFFLISSNIFFFTSSQDCSWNTALYNRHPLQRFQRWPSGHKVKETFPSHYDCGYWISFLDAVEKSPLQSYHRFWCLQPPRNQCYQVQTTSPPEILKSKTLFPFNWTPFSVFVIPEDETRRVKTYAVFLVTMFWSIFAFIWLFIIIAISSRDKVILLSFLWARQQMWPQRWRFGRQAQLWRSFLSWSWPGMTMV